MIRQILQLITVTFAGALALQSTAFAGKCGLDDAAPVMRLYGAYARDFKMPFIKGEHEINVAGCGAWANNQWLTIKTGPQVVGINSQLGYEIRDTFLDDYSVIKNAPFERSSYEDRLAFFLEERKFTQTCVLVEIEEKGPAPLTQPPKQIGCTVEKINSQKAQFTGPICYFKNTPASSFKISYFFNPKCSDKKFLVENKINPHDVRAVSGLLMSANASGDADVEDITERQIRLTLEPSPTLLPLASNFGQDTIKWANEVAYDVHMGRVTLSEKNVYDDRVKKFRFDSQMLDMSFLVNNQCKQQVCEDGLCTSLCDRVVPVGASIKVTRKPVGSNRTEFVDQWYSGFVALGRWQGFTPAAIRTYQHKAYKPGMVYRIESDLSFIDNYYRLGVDGFKSFILELPSQFPGIVGRDPLPGLNPFPAFVFRIPPFPNLPGIPGDIDPKYDPMQAFWEQLSANAAFFGQTDWPPYLARYCDQDTGTCQKLYNGQAKNSFWMEFEIEKFNDLTNKFDLKNVKWGRNSNVFPSYEREGAFPSCFEYTNSLYLDGFSCDNTRS